MSTDREPERLETQHIEEKTNPAESRVFLLVAGAMIVAAVMFGVLNTLNIIHM